MAGIDLTGDRRSQLLDLLLSQQQGNRRRPIQSGGELAARLGAQLIRQQGIRKLQAEEKASQQELVDALQGKLPRTEKTLEGFDDVPAESVSIPGKRVGQEVALSKLSPDQQLFARQLNEPGARELLKLRTEAAKSLQTTAPRETQIIETKDGDELVKQLVYKDSGEVIRELGRGPRHKPVGTTVNVGGLKPPSGFRFEDPENPQGSDLEPIPGGPADTMTPEQAAKTQLIETALSSHDEFQKFLFKDDGTVDRANVFNMMLRTPFSEGRTANVFLLDSIEAKLRAESGAAVPETEVKRAGKRFRPSVIDSDDTIKVKADLLGDFLEGAFNKTQRDGRFDIDRTIDALDATADRRLDRVKNKTKTPSPTTDAEYNALPSGTQYIHPDGTTRTKP